MYQDIISGCSTSDSKPIFFRHLNELDYIAILRNKLQSKQKYITAGIPDEEERMKTVIEFGEWSQEKEEAINNLRLSISDNEKNLPNFVLPFQKEAVKRGIAKDRKDLLDLLMDRHQVLGTTANELSNQESNAFILYISIYTDVACQQAYFPTLKACEDVDQMEFESLSEDMNKIMERFSESNIRQLSIMPFFLNSFSYSKDHLYTFLNKPIISLTSNQLLLFSQGQRNLNILSQCQGSPPDLSNNVKPNDVLTWYDQQYSIIQGKRNQAR